MYLPPAFRETDLQTLHHLIVDYSFGTLVSLVDGQLFATHLPFLLEPERGPYGTLVAHMARPNPHWRSFPGPVLAIFQGPHAYVSPSWYQTTPSVPTWNYEVVHCSGQAAVIEDPARVRALLDATVDQFEAGLSEPWSTRRVSDEYIGQMTRGIVAFEVPIERLEGKRKLSQNRPAVDIPSVAAGLRGTGEPLSTTIAGLVEAVAARSNGVERSTAASASPPAAENAPAAPSSSSSSS
jgi:transcriptional regulator